jgi:predicted GIY-YIG superfamily endonuclease
VNPVTTLYRFYNKDGALLYVGITNNCKQRFLEHRLYMKWWPEAHHSTLQIFPERAPAVEAERKAIQTENPLHNVMWGPEFTAIHEKRTAERKRKLQRQLLRRM